MSVAVPGDEPVVPEFSDSDGVAEPAAPEGVAAVGMVAGAEEPVVGGPTDVADKIRPGAGKWETGVYLTRHVDGHDGEPGGGWDGEGPDHFTELERRLIVNLRSCQQWCKRAEDQLARLLYALGEVEAVLVEIRLEE